MATQKREDVFALKTFCLITGASRGFGQCMAIRFAEKLPKDSAIMLIARSAEGLIETAAELKRVAPAVKVITAPSDLSRQTEASLDEMLNAAFSDLDVMPGNFDQALIVHNAASLGDVSKMAVDFSDMTELNDYWGLNLTSPLVLNSVFLKHFGASTKQRVIINISSICGLMPFKSWSIYCAGKAARDMLFKTMAAEDDQLQILNYAPGPIDTEMQVIARRDTADTDLKQMFLDLKAKGTLLSCNDSVDKLIPFLQKNNFESGSHVDYYDI